jgi:maleate cis-trans isomerase
MSRPDRPLGWRKRIGVLSPTVMETACHDFFRMAPDGVSICSITSNVEHWNNENFKQAVIDPLVTLSKYLASRNVDYIMHCGMPVVTLRGKGFEEEIVRIISDASGLPASTSIRSAIRALAHLGINNVVVVSPYPQELHQSALTFLKASGFDIAAAVKRTLAAAKKADGVYIPCNQWAAADAAPIIEAECGVPVVSGAHADHWEAFRVLGIDDPLPGNGRLMESLCDGARLGALAGRHG